MAKLSSALYPGVTHPAIIVPTQGDPLVVSHGRLADLVVHLHLNLESLGISPHSTVAIALPNSLEFVVAFLTITSLRAIAAPLNPAYKREEFEFYIDDLNAGLLLVPRGSFEQDGAAVRAARKHQAAIAEIYWDSELQDIVLDVKEKGKLEGIDNADIVRAEPDDIALVLHTSGTTGRPKAVPLTHRNLTRTMSNIQQTYQLSPNDRTLLVMPLFHIHGLVAGLLAPLLSVGSVIIPTRFSASEFWHHFIEYKANWYTAVPTIHQILLKNPLPSPKPYIRFIRSCSSPLSPSVFHQLEKTFDAPVLEAYAMTEAAHQMTSNPLPPAKRQPGSVGIGQGVDVKILDDNGNEVPRRSEGEICIRGENVTRGYLNNPEANRTSFTRMGYFRTGDQGKQDADGYVFITGRIKELINKGGEKISPIELDNVLAQHPVVSEAVCFAIAGDLYGQDVGVAVVLKEGKELGKDELKHWIAERVAKFKVPKKVYFTSTMPKTATGKIQRRMVADTMLKQEAPRAKI